MRRTGTNSPSKALAIYDATDANLAVEAQTKTLTVDRKDGRWILIAPGQGTYHKHDATRRTK